MERKDDLVTTTPQVYEHYLKYQAAQVVPTPPPPPYQVPSWFLSSTRSTWCPSPPPPSQGYMVRSPPAYF